MVCVFYYNFKKKTPAVPHALLPEGSKTGWMKYDYQELVTNDHGC